MKNIFIFGVLVVFVLCVFTSCKESDRSAKFNAKAVENYAANKGVSQIAALAENQAAMPTEKNYGKVIEEISLNHRQAIGALSAAGYYEKSVGNVIISPFTRKTYELKYIEDFNGTALNSANWTIGTTNSNTDEQQAYTGANVEISDGQLTIWGKKESFNGKNYTSGKIHSKDKRTYQFGRIEMLAKLPYSQGMWPAFWTLGTLRGWPWGGEIDIMEMVGGRDKWGNLNRDATFSSGIHWCKPEATASTAYSTDHINKGIGSYSVPNKATGGKLADEYHVYGIEWTDTQIGAYIDNTYIGQVSIIDDTTKREAFFQKHYMIINLAIGGNWAGDPESYDKAVWPQQYKVDWVKVWQTK